LKLNGLLLTMQRSRNIPHRRCKKIQHLIRIVKADACRMAVALVINAECIFADCRSKKSRADAALLFNYPFLF
jgi:hypothetical protein